MSIKTPSMPRDRMILLIVRLLLWLPAVVLLLAAITDNLSVNPIQAAVQRTGLTAIILLGLSLASTPVKIFTGWPILIPLRKIFGLHSFYYAAAHMLLFVVLDYGMDINRLMADAAGKPFIIVGVAAFLILFLLAVSSNRPAMVWLGRNWKRLHRLVYLAAPLAGLHFAWALKGNLATLSGNILWPVVYLFIVFILLIVRIPVVRRYISAMRSE